MFNKYLEVSVSQRLPIQLGGIPAHQGFIIWQWQISPGFASDTDPSETEYTPP